MPQQTKGRVIGIGGVFLKSPDEARLSTWYQEKLGLPASLDQGVFLRWRSFEHPNEEHRTVWAAFADDSDYFAPSSAKFMVNYVVDDLDAMLARLKSEGVAVDPKQEDYPYGRFGWAFDPDGNKIELWEPPTSDAQA